MNKSNTITCPYCREEWEQNFIEENKLKTKKREIELFEETELNIES